MAHIHPVYDTDTHFKINALTREIKADPKQKVKLIQYDHNAERFTFELPRYIEGHDMSLCNDVEVHFLNIETATKVKKTGLYPVKDLQISPDDEGTVICSWLISRNATQLAGQLHFLINYQCVAGEIIEYAWHTDVYKNITVSDGINADETFEAEYVDIIEHWKADTINRITAAVNANVSAWEEAEAAKLRAIIAENNSAVNQALAVERERINQFTSLKEGSTTGDAELMDIRIDADGITHDTAGESVRHAKRMFVNLSGSEQVFPKNIFGVKTDCENLFDTATPYARGKYVDVVNGVIVLQDSAGLDTYIMPVDGASKYSFTNCRTAVVVGEDKQTIIGELHSNAALTSTTLDSTGGAYIIFSFNYTRFPVGMYVISLGETLQTQTYEMPEWTGIPKIQHRLDGIDKTGAVAIAPYIKGDLSDGSAIILNALTNIRKNEIISFCGDVETMGTVEIGLSTSTETVVRSAYILIDSTAATTNFDYSGEDTEEHGLVINNNIFVTLANDGVNLTATVISNGVKYQKIVPYVRFALSAPYCKITGGSIVNCKLSWNAFDVKKPIWLFGDSYFSTTSASRWMSYLHEAGFTDNALISSHAGATSVNAWESLKTLCAYGLPKAIVWCMGMNDGSDNDNAQQWFTYRDKLLTFCEENNIVPVFATIPSVPTISHEEKNAWIRTNGSAYIDFAKAVGATSEGVWFDGMLSTDGIHPTEKGAKNLYGRFMVDFPEITLK